MLEIVAIVLGSLLAAWAQTVHIDGRALVRATPRISARAVVYAALIILSYLSYGALEAFGVL